MEQFESWDYSRTFQAGRVQFRRTRRRWQEERLHDWQLAYTVAGQGTVFLGDRSLVTRPGEILLFRPKAPRAYEPGGKPVLWAHIWVHFQPDDSFSHVLERLTGDEATTRLVLPTPELRKKILRDLSEMCDVGASQASYREQLATKLLETALIRCLSIMPAHDRRDPALDPRLKRAMDLLSEDLASPFDSTALARACGLSQRQLFRLFAVQTNHSPRDYLEICRLARARQLLTETALSVGEVGEQVGFESPFYFTTRFTHYTGMSPRAFQRKQRR